MASGARNMETSSGNRGQGGYNPTHGGYFGGPPALVSSYTGGGSPLVGQWRQFVQNQHVEVNIQGQGWVVGAVVAVVHAMQAFGSTVKYFKPSIGQILHPSGKKFV
ncbi:hypothetical protein GALMADRAFT_215193 [Galerina marginata CBS 339.88]|uniref:Uncharacterized protein n=1 Tax=Galerina marginata (strain CBS 339.88) TaxID=685588 RepID=A0A067SDY2_GALM3|nr:hypothetical protein GALMADRAFT_215193 [Galerina marginata CBS 339.88]